MSKKYKYFDKEILELVNRISQKVHKFNRTLPARLIDALPNDKIFPIVFTMLHEHKAGVICKPHVRCMFVVPNESNDNVTQLLLDVDMTSFDSLPEMETPENKDGAEQPDCVGHA